MPMTLIFFPILFMFTSNDPKFGNLIQSLLFYFLRILIKMSNLYAQIMSSNILSIILLFWDHKWNNNDTVNGRQQFRHYLPIFNLRWNFCVHYFLFASNITNDSTTSVCLQSVSVVNQWYSWIELKN